MATPEGVEEDKAPKPNPQLNDRNTYLDELATAARAKRDEQPVEGENYQDPPAAETPPDPPPEASPPPDPVSQDQETPPEEMITLVVDGVQKEVPKSKVYDAGKRALQKDFTADQRLEEATQLLNEAKQMKPADPPPPEPVKPDIKQVVETIQYGNTEDAAEALQSVIGAQPATPETENVREIVRENINLETAIQSFQAPPDKGGFGDLWQDPNLMQIVLNKEQEARNNGDRRPHWELYQEIGNEVREWAQGFGKPAPTNGGNTPGGDAPTTNAADSEDRRQRKQQAGQPPAGHNAGGGTSGQAPPQRKTHKDILQEMREKRGQV